MLTRTKREARQTSRTTPAYPPRTNETPTETLFPQRYTSSSSSDFTCLGQPPPSTLSPNPDTAIQKTNPSTSHHHTPVAPILPPLSRALREIHPEIQSSVLCPTLSAPPHSFCAKEARLTHYSHSHTLHRPALPCPIHLRSRDEYYSARRGDAQRSQRSKTTGKAKQSKVGNPLEPSLPLQDRLPLSALPCASALVSSLALALGTYIHTHIVP